MVDMHTHILYGVDDGSESIEKTLRMLQQAVDEGITDIIATPHTFHPQYHVPAAVVQQQVTFLRQQCASLQLPLTVHTGQEVRLCEDLLEQLQKGEALTLANSRYLLLELPSSNVPSYTKSIVTLLQSQGITPIIAHPERNKGIAEKPEKLEELIRLGAMAQITAGSCAGHFGKAVQKLSVQLIKANLIHCYGSDVHNLETRPFLFDAGLTYLEQNKLESAVEMILENNARILTNEPFIQYEPQLEQKKWWQLF